MVEGLVVVMGSRMFQNHVMCWQMELPIFGTAEIGDMCSSDVMNNYMCDRCDVNMSQDVL